MSTHSPAWLAVLLVAGTAASSLMAFDVPPGTRRVEELQGQLISRIAFGSCSDQNRPQPVLERVVEHRPDLFIYLGDNIYGDTYDMNVLREKYAILGRRPEFQALRKAVPVIATWDDHDYGLNDGGKEYSMKRESKEIFLEFFLEPEASERRRHEGIYTSYRFEGNGRTVQVILLDTRTFRDPLATNAVTSWKNEYHPDPNPEKTMLGSRQWRWLEARLREPADLRIIGSSIQFAHEYNGWESWTNLPSELLRMLDLIRRTRAEGVIFISGDVHWGELSVLKPDGMYPIHDVTSSGINQNWDVLEPNRNRFGSAVMENNFGLIEVDWSAADPLIRLNVIDVDGQRRVQKEVRLSELRFPPPGSEKKK